MEGREPLIPPKRILYISTHSWQSWHSLQVMAVSFFVNWGVSNTDPAALLEGLIVPRLPTYAVTQAVGTIEPYP